MAEIQAVHSYKDALDILGGSAAKKIGFNTVLRMSFDTPFVQLNGHTIAVFYSDGSREYCNAGFPTVPTRNRLNQLSNDLTFFQKSGRQYVVNRLSADKWSEPINFETYITVTPDGKITSDFSDKT